MAHRIQPILACGRIAPPQKPPQKNPKKAWRRRFEAYLHEKGLKHSDQRFQIAEIILSSSDHLSAQEIVAQVRKVDPSIGPATIYRNIKVLCEAKILSESLNDASGRVVYESLDQGHHDHLICLDCDEIFEFHESRIERLQEDVIQALGFQPSHHKHVIYAHCEALRKKDNTTKGRKNG